MIHRESREGMMLPIRSRCLEVKAKALAQAVRRANHPALFHHIALMPDCHVGFGMPIGVVVAAREAGIPNTAGSTSAAGCGRRPRPGRAEAPRARRGELACLPLDEGLARDYLRDMGFALRYAAESRRLMMEALKKAFAFLVPGAGFDLEIGLVKPLVRLEALVVVKG